MALAMVCTTLAQNSPKTSWTPQHGPGGRRRRPRVVGRQRRRVR
ncbi:hypothetical protein MUK42_27985 [Musa troglodytarum]|nr:hypothetical protein MUK42_27985 [Musa troglodytarum]